IATNVHLSGSSYLIIHRVVLCMPLSVQLPEMALDFEDRLDRVTGFGLAVVFVQIKAERPVANTASILCLELVRQIGLHPRPLVDDEAVMRVEVDAFLPYGLGEFDLAAAYPIGVDEDRKEER